jgi:hypothetical protein
VSWAGQQAPLHTYFALRIAAVVAIAIKTHVNLYEHRLAALMTDAIASSTGNPELGWTCSGLCFTSKSRRTARLASRSGSGTTSLANHSSTPASAPRPPPKSRPPAAQPRSAACKRAARSTRSGDGSADAEEEHSSPTRCSVDISVTAACEFEHLQLAR